MSGAILPLPNTPSWLGLLEICTSTAIIKWSNEYKKNVILGGAIII
jgi:hypothetical protein